MDNKVRMIYCKCQGIQLDFCFKVTLLSKKEVSGLNIQVGNIIIITIIKCKIDKRSSSALESKKGQSKTRQRS